METLGLLFFVAVTAGLVSALCSVVGLTTIRSGQPAGIAAKALFFGAWGSFLVLLISAVAPVLMFGFEDGADASDLIVIAPPAVLLFFLTKRHIKGRAPAPSTAHQA